MEKNQSKGLFLNTKFQIKLPLKLEFLDRLSKSSFVYRNARGKHNTKKLLQDSQIDWTKINRVFSFPKVSIKSARKRYLQLDRRDDNDADDVVASLGNQFSVLRPLQCCHLSGRTWRSNIHKMGENRY